MKNSFLRRAALLAFTCIAITTTAFAQKKDDKAALVNQIKELTAANAEVAKHLSTFDTLDFTVFSNRDWTRLHESHAKNIKVHFLMAILKSAWNSILKLWTQCLSMHRIHV